MRILGIAGLIITGLFLGTNSALPKDAALPKGWPTDALGAAETEAVAKERAVREALKIVERMMKTQEPPIRSIVVTEEYVRKHIVDAGKADKPVGDPPNQLKTWVVNFRTDNNWWADIVRQDRAKQREALTGFAIMGLACLLLAAVGYTRLDEYTQRRYTTWLRIAGVGVAGTLIAGWWWVFFQTPS